MAGGPTQPPRSLIKSRLNDECLRAPHGGILFSSQEWLRPAFRRRQCCFRVVQVSRVEMRFECSPVTCSGEARGTCQMGGSRRHGALQRWHFCNQRWSKSAQTGRDSQRWLLGARRWLLGTGKLERGRGHYGATLTGVRRTDRKTRAGRHPDYGQERFVGSWRFSASLRSHSLRQLLIAGPCSSGVSPRAA